MDLSWSMNNLSIFKSEFRIQVRSLTIGTLRSIFNKFNFDKKTKIIERKLVLSKGVLFIYFNI